MKKLATALIASTATVLALATPAAPASPAAPAKPATAAAAPAVAAATTPATAATPAAAPVAEKHAKKGPEGKNQHIKADVAAKTDAGKADSGKSVTK